MQKRHLFFQKSAHPCHPAVDPVGPCSGYWTWLSPQGPSAQPWVAHHKNHLVATVFRVRWKLVPASAACFVEAIWTLGASVLRKLLDIPFRALKPLGCQTNLQATDGTDGIKIHFEGKKTGLILQPPNWCQILLNISKVWKQKCQVTHHQSPFELINMDLTIQLISSKGLRKSSNWSLLW